MKSEYIFPALLVIQNLFAAVMYGLRTDFKMMSYWLLSGAILAVVTFWK